MRAQTADVAALRIGIADLKVDILKWVFAMIMGSVLASFSVEDFSLDRFRRLDLSQVRERFAAFADLVHFEKIKL